MSASSRARLVDPLAEPQELPVAAPNSQSSDRSCEQPAPDVPGLPGTDAVEFVRAAGLLAAIQAVDGEPAGTVPDQDPQAGTPLAAGAVLTLQVAAQREREETHTEPIEEPRGIGEAVAVDDTQEWFRRARRRCRSQRSGERIRGRSAGAPYKTKPQRGRHTLFPAILLTVAQAGYTAVCSIQASPARSTGSATSTTSSQAASQQSRSPPMPATQPASSARSTVPVY
jgi:hypothetical protein